MNDFSGLFSARASSELNRDFVPSYAIDGKISSISQYFYHSKKEDYPWLQLALPESVISGVKIVTRVSCCKERFQNIEVRAGMDSVEVGFKGRLKVNTKVGFYTGPPSTNGQTITITFDKTVLAKYITIQHTGQKAILEVNEVTLLHVVYECVRYTAEQQAKHVASPGRENTVCESIGMGYKYTAVGSKYFKRIFIQVEFC